MSDSAETLVVCPNNDDDKWIDSLSLVLAVLGGLSGVIAYFIQRRAEQKEAAEAQAKEDADLDRAQALERTREVMSVFVGPLHRLWKTQTTVLVAYRIGTGYKFLDYQNAAMKKGQNYWMTIFPKEFVEPFIENPYSPEAVKYRNLCSRRLKFLYTRARELILQHMSNLADMPSQDEWLERYEPEDITSPYVKSMNINTIFDTYTAWTLEFDDIIEGWENENFAKMMPSTRVPLLICNALIDILYDNAKAKEAMYNKHITIHRNTRQTSAEDQIKTNMFNNTFGKIDLAAEVEKGKNHIQGILSRLQGEDESQDEEKGKQESESSVKQASEEASEDASGSNSKSDNANQDTGSIIANLVANEQRNRRLDFTGEVSRDNN